jgi:hypothetical protein
MGVSSYRRFLHFRSWTGWLLAAVLAVGVAACADGENSDRPLSAQTSAPSSRAAMTTAGAIPETPATTATASDLRVCAAPDGLETRGLPFSKTYLEILKGNQEVSASELVDQLRAITTIGAPAGTSDGREAIEEASFEVRQAILNLVKDAKALIPDGNSVVLPDNGMTDFVFSFTQAITSCKTAGYLVSWMKPTR